MVICSTSFITLGRTQLKALGAPDTPIAVIPHPFGLRTREEVRASRSSASKTSPGLHSAAPTKPKLV